MPGQYSQHDGCEDDDDAKSNRRRSGVKNQGAGSRRVDGGRGGLAV